MFHDAILYMQYNTATLAERKKAQNKLNKTGHVSEMQVALDILRFRFCLIKLSERLFHMLMNYNLSYYSNIVVELSIALEHQNDNKILKKPKLQQEIKISK